MIDRDTQLLCTFSSIRSYQKDIDALAKYYMIDGNRVYVLQNAANLDDLFLTYNVVKSAGIFYPKTISVHRKKDVNVIYSINALNELVKLENDGEFSAQVDISWDKYRNSLITTKDGKLKITSTKLLTIFRL
jgi:hypothetical protein